MQRGNIAALDDSRDAKETFVDEEAVVKTLRALREFADALGFDARTIAADVVAANGIFDDALEEADATKRVKRAALALKQTIAENRIKAVSTNDGTDATNAGWGAFVLVLGAVFVVGAFVCAVCAQFDEQSELAARLFAFAGIALLVEAAVVLNLWKVLIDVIKAYFGSQARR